VNTYDPAEDIVYRHTPREADFHANPGELGRGVCRLPTGYSNTSPRTRIAPPASRLDAFWMPHPPRATHPSATPATAARN
jgi:hypothetical protein